VNFVEAIKLAVAAILANKLRSFLTLLGIIFGVATVIVVVSLIEGFNRYVDEKIADIGTNAFRVQKFSIEDFSSVSAYQEARKRNKDVTLEDLAALREQGGSIRDAGAVAFHQAEIRHGSTKLLNVRVEATTSNMAEINRVDVAQGRYFTRSEEDHNRNVCFIGNDVAEKLFPMGSSIGETIKIDGRPYKVIGVSAVLGSVFGQPRDMFVNIPLSNFMSTYGLRRSILISITSTSAATYLDAIDEARLVMRIRRKLGPGEKDNFGLITPSAINSLREKIFGTIQTVAVGVTSIALVVGGIVIMNIMLISVTERTKEIGIRKSMGARRGDILKQFLAESIILSLLGGLIGVAIAFLLSKLVSTLSPIPTSLPMLAVGMALFVSGSVGLISGMYPAWKAARLDPIVALRAE
jgi:putative ABC transport system permease protein